MKKTTLTEPYSPIICTQHCFFLANTLKQTYFGKIMSYTKEEKIFTLTSIIRQQRKLGNYLIAQHISTIHQSD